jgi:hypothetical protein
MDRIARVAIAAVVGLASIGGGCASYTISRYAEIMEGQVSSRDRIDELERVQGRLEHRIERLEDWRKDGPP